MTSLDQSSAVLTAARMLRLAERPLPQVLAIPFNLLSTTLVLIAHREAHGLDALDHALAVARDRQPGDLPSFERVTAQAIADGRANLSLLLQAAALLRALEPHEAAVRAIVEGRT